eukprot:TRINITY_DN53802_c0_g1_i1.p1 TRINITY_DN53802_c0_g1~~TRINITY_DN53802_c0_g1_i1.p1  ORF type:complete len:179 (+),score=26.99 TRINITY_DN53802_c0_g1_i1:22-537(+)
MSDLDNVGVDDEDVKLTLISLEQERYTVSRRVALMSELIRTIVDGDSSSTEIPLPHVKGSILHKVVLYMKYHADNPAKEIEKPLKSPIMSEVVEQWDADFIDVEQEQLFDLVLAASYLHIKSLLDLCCAKVASILKNKTAEQIRKALNVQGDFSKEEEDQISNDARWAEER